MAEKQVEPKSAPADSSGSTVESVCNRFEAACRSGQRPDLNDYLKGWEEPERSKLLSELLLLELNYAGREGQTFAASTYIRRFPEHAEVVQEVFHRLSIVQSEETLVTGGETFVMQSQLAALRFHAQGGLGVVFRAGDKDLSRDVAVKFIRSTLAEDAECRDRFRLEAEITGRLEHPGVVPVYGFGDDGKGGLFYAMRFIEGETLDDAIARYHNPPPGDKTSPSQREVHFREMLGRFVAVCKTIAYAHNRGIIHRDIKPENVMLGRYGETVVIDWGLALPVNRQGVFKHSGEQTLTPSSGSQASNDQGGVAGTPSYMSPEQAEGSAELTPATDVYSLGATLYKILAGKVPFSGRLEEVCANVRRGAFEAPSRVERRAPKPAEAICLKAMSLKPGERFATAMDLARDIENYLADASVSAYREPLSTKLVRWGRRHRLVSLSILIGLLILTLGGMSSALIFGRLNAETEQLRQSEHQMREHSMSVSARFAARTIANKVDIRLRMLEKKAADAKMHAILAQLNLDPQDEAARQQLQDWIDVCGKNYGHVESRSWFVCTDEGWQVARFPSHKQDGTIFESLSKNYAWRDYFHGRGKDYGQEYAGAPLAESQLSVAMVSTNDADPIVVLSAPIISEDDGAVIGIIGMSIEMGEFTDLRVALPQGQKVLLVDTRTYYLMRSDGVEERGEGLVLQHEDLPQWITTHKSFPHLGDAVVDRMRETRTSWDVASQDVALNNLFGPEYRDPLADKEEGPWLAAFAPVILSARPSSTKAHDTGCFVIIQQPAN